MALRIVTGNTISQTGKIQFLNTLYLKIYRRHFINPTSACLFFASFSINFFFGYTSPDIGCGLPLLFDQLAST